MFIRLITRKICYWREQKRVLPKKQVPPASENSKISINLDVNISTIKQILGSGGDIRIHEFTLGSGVKTRGALIYIDGLVDSGYITDSILKPLLMYSRQNLYEIDKIKNTVLCSGDVTEIQELSELINGCLSGDTALILDKSTKGLIISTKGWDKRGISEPHTEAVVRGPREGFTENFRTNTALIRRRIKTPGLKMEHMKIGEKTQTSVCIAYIDKVADPQLVEKIKNRLTSFNVDSIIDSGYIEDYIEDAPFSIFATVGHTEKPDVVAAKILEGRAAIIVDGSPFVLTAPMLFIESFQSAEDYYIRSIYSSLIRLLRYVAFLISVFAPAVYIALTTFHQELIPTTLLLTVASAREGTPFPAYVEALIMVFSFEILREAGLRLPRPIGQAVSIVGALIMGEAAVSAGLVGAPMVITIAVTAVASFVVPEQNDSGSILRLISLLLATVLGGFGIAMCFLSILVYLASLHSFGTPFFEGLDISHDQQDTYIRMPLWSMVKRPGDIAHNDTTRRNFFIPPIDTLNKDDDDI